MFGIISKEDKKKVLQKVRESKDKDLEIWKYVAEKLFVVWLLITVLSFVSLEVIVNWNIVTLQLKIIAIIGLVLAVISYIGMMRDLIELTRKNKKESEK